MKKETSIALLEYIDNIVFVRIKEGVLINAESLNEQFEAERLLSGNDNYGVLVDGSNYSVIPGEARILMAAYSPKGRKATAIVSNNNLASLLTSRFYLKVNKPKNMTKIFNTEEEAIIWLKNKLRK